MRLDAEELMEDKKAGGNKPKEPNDNRGVIGIVIAIVIILITICILVMVMQQLNPKDAEMKIYVDDKEVGIDNSVFLFENDKLYVCVKGIAKHIGYDSHRGEFKIEAEDSNKVFVENKQETASMFLNSSVISKTIQNINDDYKNYEMSEPAREINGEIYVISDGIQIACNITIDYDSSQNRIDIRTLDYYYQAYNTAMQQRGFKEVDDDFENKKAILYDRVIVQNQDGEYGVVNSKGNEIVGARYKYIQFDEYTQEFTITNNDQKVGIDYIDGGTKIKIEYDEIKSIDKKEGLYLIRKNDKYGVIDNNEKIIIHTEYDEIGVDLEPYSSTTQKAADSLESNEASIVKQYVFFETLIPVKQSALWGFFDVKGNKVCEMKYTGIGCIARKATDKNTNSNTTNNTTTTINKKTTNNLLMISEYELIVVEKNGKYGLIDVNAKEILPTSATDLYSITNAGIKTYYMQFNGGVYDLEKDLFVRLGLEKKNVDEELKKKENEKESIIDNILQGNSTKNETTNEIQENNVQNEQTNIEQENQTVNN